MRPGITVRPERSTVSAPAGTAMSAARPTRAMRSPSMTMRPFSIGAAPLPSMMRALSRTTARLRVSAAATEGRSRRCPRRRHPSQRGGAGLPSKSPPTRTRDPGSRVHRARRGVCRLPRGGAMWDAARRIRNRGRDALNPRFRNHCGKPAVPVVCIDDDGPAVRRAERRAHEHSRGLIVGRHHGTDSIEQAPRPPETGPCTGVRCRSPARTVAAPSRAHSRRIRRWAPKTHRHGRSRSGRSACVRPRTGRGREVGCGGRRESPDGSAT